jgi:ribonuclease PH
VALYDALDLLVRKGALERVPLVGQCAAVSVGVVHGEPRLDLCYAEDSTADVDMNLVMRDDGTFVEIQGSAEGASFSRATMERLLSTGEKGIRELFALQRAALGLPV